MSDKNKKTMTQMLAAIIIALLGFLGTMIAERQSTFKEFSDMTKEIRAITEMKTVAELSALDLRYQLREKITMADVLEGYMDSLPTPAWIKKRRDDGNYEMLLINESYERHYDITKEAYHNKIDSEVWPDEMVIEFKKHDDLVFNTKKSHCMKEYVIIQGVKVRASMCKFLVKMQGEKFGVGGIVMHHFD